MNKDQEYSIDLESERLIIRNIIPADIDFIINLWTNPTVTEYMGGPRNIEQLKNSVLENIEEPFKDEFDLWILLNKSTGKLVGHCGLLEKEVDGAEEIEVIYVIDDRFWGNGFASEAAKMLISFAFNEKHLDSVIALIKPQNSNSQKVAVKSGMAMDKEVIRPGNIRMMMYRIRKQHYNRI